ncbi:hypothetical protein RM549_17805 [Salegentibacter sp. F188]|uniref:Uncharacterized protein n=1 Tax=Autumnicola patrickiae TaxID=3075591 RepID=A0ABU3E6V8_9FLAO|nr:hypothetical protein [Salegentibacter sp. F188]MDT0691652.1 hypothetical protein [Salegentibacter sp. F188]
MMLSLKKQSQNFPVHPRHCSGQVLLQDYLWDFLRTRELPDKIIKAQRREIMEMQWLINDIRENGIVETEEEKKERPVPDFEGWIEKETIDLEE